MCHKVQNKNTYLLTKMSRNLAINSRFVALGPSTNNKYRDGNIAYCILIVSRDKARRAAIDACTEAFSSSKDCIKCRCCFSTFFRVKPNVPAAEEETVLRVSFSVSLVI